MVKDCPELFRRIVLATLFTLTPVSLNVPVAPEVDVLLPIMKAAVLDEVTSTAPTS